MACAQCGFTNAHIPGCPAAFNPLGSLRLRPFNAEAATDVACPTCRGVEQHFLGCNYGFVGLHAARDAKAVTDATIALNEFGRAIVEALEPLRKLQEQRDGN